MMDLMDRLEWLTLGCIIGFVSGYVVGRLREIQHEVHDIKEGLGVMEGDVKRFRDERGIMTHRWSANIALFVVVSLTLYAAIMSQLASNKSNETANSIIKLQEAQTQNANCTTQVLFDVVAAADSRTDYTVAQIDSNIQLVQGQLDLLVSFSSQPPLSEEESLIRYNTYVEQVENFIRIARKTRDQLVENPYPTVKDLTAYLTDAASTQKE